jgi:hypothetical protein
MRGELRRSWHYGNDDQKQQKLSVVFENRTILSVALNSRLNVRTMKKRFLGTHPVVVELRHETAVQLL